MYNKNLIKVTSYVFDKMRGWERRKCILNKSDIIAVRYLRLFLLAGVLTMGFGEKGLAQISKWSLELQGGVPYNIPMPLTIKQENEPGIRLNARFRSEPFVSPGYYNLRIGRWKNGKSWEFEFVHHKLFLDNKPPEIQEYSISHGYNIVVVNRALEKNIKNFPFVLRLGAGVVLAHPEITVRGQTLAQDEGLFGWGYYISGPVLNIAVAKRFYIVEQWFVNTELKFNPSYARVPVAGGHAIFWNMPITFAFGMGIDLFKNDNSGNPGRN